MFKRDLQQTSHEARSIKYSPWYAVFIKHGLIGDNQECLKRTFEISHMKSGPSNMILVWHVY